MMLRPHSSTIAISQLFLSRAAIAPTIHFVASSSSWLHSNDSWDSATHAFLRRAWPTVVRHFLFSDTPSSSATHLAATRPFLSVVPCLLFAGDTALRYDALFHPTVQSRGLVFELHGDRPLTLSPLRRSRLRGAVQTCGRSCPRCPSPVHCADHWRAMGNKRGSEQKGLQRTSVGLLSLWRWTTSCHLNQTSALGSPSLSSAWGIVPLAAAPLRVWWPSLLQLFSLLLLLVHPAPTGLRGSPTWSWRWCCNGWACGSAWALSACASVSIA
jgi:hypothetical protein